MDIWEWQNRARCREDTDPDLFFAPFEPGSPRYAHLVTKDQREKAREKDRNRAKALCRACPVIADCLKYVLDNEIQDGIWGATTPADRTRLRNKTAANAA
jgi:WhiB family redox-sensing transcriptional regulator